MNVITLLLVIGASVEGPFLGGTTVKPYENSHLVMLLSETIDTRLSPSLADYSGSRFIVKFDHPPTGTDRSTLKDAELTIATDCTTLYNPRRAARSGDVRSDRTKIYDFDR
ncbi:hypothetical protein KAX21_06540 [candidate division WOR-3 bacterium]|nr:hypothetical protein [candidate division WOR-3 bacterium]